MWLESGTAGGFGRTAGDAPGDEEWGGPRVKGPVDCGELANVFQQKLSPSRSGEAQPSPLPGSWAHLFIYILSGAALVQESSDHSRDRGAPKAKIFPLGTLTENVSWLLTQEMDRAERSGEKTR